MLKYKGYVGAVQFDDESMIFHGEVIGINDVITFRGETPQEIINEFKKSIDGYLEWCDELGQSPNRSFTGKLLLRIDPAIHQKAFLAASSEGMSLNGWINSAISHLVSDVPNSVTKRL